MAFPVVPEYKGRLAITSKAGFLTLMKQENLMKHQGVVIKHSNFKT